MVSSLPKYLCLILFIILLTSSTSYTLAVSAPTLSSPSDGSTIASGPSLTWQAVEGSVQYKVIVDDEPTITSPYVKDPYDTTNAKYSPRLTAGRYFWKVATKDASGSWSNWSPIWSFTLTPTIPTPSPNISPPASSPTPSSTSTRSNFTASQVPSQIDADQSFTVSLDLNVPSSPNSTFYLKGAFKKEGSSNYFGQTKVGSSWVKNGASYSSQHSITTDSSGRWFGSLEVKADSSDSGFSGSGDYKFRTGRYSAAGSGPTWSNETTIQISGQKTSNDDGQVAPSSTLLPKSSSSVKGISKSITKGSKPQGSIAKEATKATPSAFPSISPTPSSPVKDQARFNFLPILGGVMVLSGLGSLVYIYLKQRTGCKPNI